jgi:hypothetical protein
LVGRSINVKAHLIHTTVELVLRLWSDGDVAENERQSRVVDKLDNASAESVVENQRTVKKHRDATRADTTNDVLPLLQPRPPSRRRHRDDPLDRQRRSRAVRLDFDAKPKSIVIQRLSHDRLRFYAASTQRQLEKRRRRSATVGSL